MANNDDFDTTTISASSAAFSLYGEAEIEAPASLVFQTYIDTSTWAKWNTLNPQVNILKHHSLENQNQQNQGPTVVINNAQLVTDPSSGAAQFQAMSPMFREGTLFHLASNTQKSGFSSFSSYICYEVDAEERSVSWVYDDDHNPWPKFMLSIERTTRVDDLGNGRCKIRTLERQKGPMAFYYKMKYAKSLQKGFEDQVQGLKKYIESNSGQQ